MYKFEKIILLGLVAFGISILFMFLFYGGKIHESIYPELVGFSLEGIILVVLFGVFLRRQNRKDILIQKIELKKALRAEMAIFLFWTKLIDTDSKDKDEDFKFLIESKELDKMISNLDVKDLHQHIDLQLDFIKSFSIRQLPILIALIPTAANINSTHLTYWSLIINNLNGISSAESDDKILEALKEFLMALKRFDNAEVK